jgi:nicotinamide mononucleotide adenylyltransferase
MVGSSNKSKTDENPFTTQERIEMLKSFLESGGFSDRCIIEPVPDFDTSDDRWFKTVMKKFPGVKRLYSNNERTKRIFKSKGLGVVPIPFLDRDKLSGTYIRSNKEEVDNLVPGSSKRIIEKSID